MEIRGRITGHKYDKKDKEIIGIYQLFRPFSIVGEGERRKKLRVRLGLPEYAFRT